jgi:xanthine/CO dehydrogenase XdhC/CoxF family maturation factor
MTNELKQLFHSSRVWQQAGKKTVMATVVHLEGSSYRRPGVRMLISETGEAVGAISGGCVEKEIIRQAQSVVQTGKSKIMTYDGRFRVGCEGVIYLLLEPIFISEDLWRDFEAVLKKRQTFSTECYYYPEPGEKEGIGSRLILGDASYSLDPAFQPDRTTDQEYFKQSFSPVFQLYIFGAEHDAVRLCKAAHQLGWEVTIVASPDESKSLTFFPGAERLITPAFDSIDTSSLDEHTAVVLMSHSFHKDVQYLIALKEVKPAYFGLLWPGQRRENLLAEFINYCPDTSPEFLEQLHGPAGINIGAETASEVAVSILAEIFSVVRNQEPMALLEKTGSIHG